MGRARDRASADLNGQEFILDADADTSISADTDDQIDIKIAGNDTAIVAADSVKIRSDNAGLIFRRTTSEADIAKIQYVNGNPSLDIGADGKNVRFTNGGSYAETMRVGTNGQITIQDGDLVIGTSGHGIDFSAASNDSEMTSELLDDYEEGLATMAFSVGAGTVTINSTNDTLAYTKIGRMVHINGQVSVDSVSGIGTGNTLQLTGLPFAAENLTGVAGRCGFFIMHDAAANVTDGREIIGFINEGGAVINIYEQNSSGASNHAEHMTSNTSLYIMATYTAAT